MKIYCASSWRNLVQSRVVRMLRLAGHDVYDFRLPPERTGFQWSEIDPVWQHWTPEEFRSALDHPIARAGFASDMNALMGCDVCVLVLPCGRSAHLEAGFAAGAGKPVMVLLSQCEPELMYRMCYRLCCSVEELITNLADCARGLSDPANRPSRESLSWEEHADGCLRG